MSLALIRPRAMTAPATTEPGRPATTEPGRPAPAGPADQPGRPTADGPSWPGGTAEPESADGMWLLWRRARLLQVIVVVVVGANLAMGGTFEVALPALAHARFGAGGYGALIACFGAAAVAGTLAAAGGGRAARPALLACAAFPLEAVAMAFIPFLGGLAGAAAATLVLGGCNGLGNVIFMTLVQRWAPPRLLGRVMSLVMLAALGSFPLSAAVSGVLVRHLGPSPFFPVAGATVAAAALGALSQREFRDFGTSETLAPELGIEHV